MDGALQHSLGAPLHRSFLPLNLHSARVRRNRGRLPSSRCIESARTHRARARALPPRASDTTLGLPVTNPRKLPITPFLDNFRLADKPLVIRVPKDRGVQLRVTCRKRDKGRQSVRPGQ
jgi:hypothetical protein